MLAFEKGVGQTKDHLQGHRELWRMRDHTVLGSQRGWKCLLYQNVKGLVCHVKLYVIFLLDKESIQWSSGS